MEAADVDVELKYVQWADGDTVPVGLTEELVVDWSSFATENDPVAVLFVVCDVVAAGRNGAIVAAQIGAAALTTAAARDFARDFELGAETAAGSAAVAESVNADAVACAVSDQVSKAHLDSIYFSTSIEVDPAHCLEQVLEENPYWRL